MYKKRVLIVSVPSWSRKTGSDTFSSLMEGYGADDVANIYIREDLPDSKECNNYFRISENAVIKSVLKRGIKTGKRVFAEDMKDDNETNIKISKARYDKYSKKSNIIMYFAREILWKLGKWKTKELDRFIEEFNPDVVFFSMESYIHMDRIARYVIKKTGAKGIGYFWDDNFTYKKSRKLIGKIFKFLQRRELKKCVKACSSFFAITPKTKKEADETFGINCEVLTKPVKMDGEFKPYAVSTPIKMLYTGKLIIGRFDTVKLIGKALDEINKDGEKIILDIYTQTNLSEDDKKDLSPHVHILGAIPQNEVTEKQEKADVLLFAEAIKGPSALAARLSFSTKLTDYFRSGKCILAVGSKDTAPMEYLEVEDGALVAYSYEDIKEALKKITEDNELIVKYGKKAFDLGLRNHEKTMIQKRLFESFEN